MRRTRLARIRSAGAVALVAGLVSPVSAAALAPQAPAMGQLDPAQVASLGRHPTQSVIIEFKDQVAALPASVTDTSARRSAVARIQAPVVAELRELHAPELHSYALINAVSAEVSPAEVARLAADRAVSGVLPDQTTQLSFTAPSLPSSVTSPASAAGACQPGSDGVELDPEALEAIHANSNLPGSGPTAASLGITGAGVKVAFIAEGFVVNQPNFVRANGKPVVVDEKDFTGEGVGNASGGEASLDASSVAAQGSVKYKVTLPGGKTCTFRVLGAAPGASLVGLKAFPDNYEATTTALLDAIDYAVTTDHVDVLNESFGYDPLPDTMTDVIRQADEAAVAAGTVVDVSSGDAGSSNTVESPSTDPAVLSAGASTTYRTYAQQPIAPAGVKFKGWEDDNLSSLSSAGFSEGLKGPNLIAPGDLNWVSCNPSPKQYEACISGGTSEAAPLTSATAALVIQAYRKTHAGSSPTPALVKQIITSTATDVGLPADQQGSGLLDSYRAVLAAESVKTDAGTPRAKGATVLTSTDSIDATAPAGSTVTSPVAVTNTGSSTQTVRLAGRLLSAPSAVVSTTVTSSASSFQRKVTFQVKAGAAYLAAHAATTSKSSGGGLDIDLVDPMGRLAIDGLPQGATLTSNVGVRDPAPGTWTAYVTYAGSSGTSSPVAFDATIQTWQPFGTVTPPSVTLAPGASKTVTVSVTTPATAGDETAAVQLTTTKGSTTSIPVALRSLVALTGGSGSFSAQVFGGNGRGGTPASVQYFAFDVPKGAPKLDVSTTLAEGPGTDYSLFLISPAGEALGHASNQLVVGGSATQPITTTESGASSHVLDPSAGQWTAIVALANPSSATAVSSALSGTVDLSSVHATAKGLPAPGTVIAIDDQRVVEVTVRNTTNAPEAYFLDPRLDTTVTMRLRSYESKAAVDLPLTATVPQWIVPTDTTTLVGSSHASAPATFDMSPYLGNDDGELNGDPQITATTNGDTATATWSDTPVTPGDWNLDPALTGVFTKGAAAASVSLSLTATTLGFDSSVSTDYGDLWKGGTVAPVVVGPGRSTTLYAAIDPSTAGSVRGVLYVDTSAVISPFGQVVPVGDQVVALPYGYTTDK